MDFTFFDDAKKYLLDHRAKGVNCPLCEQYARVYRRKLNSSQAVALIKLVRLWREKLDWIHVSELRTATDIASDFGQLAHWRLMMQKPNDNDAKKTSGLWKPTVEGIRFVDMQQRVPTHRIIYNNRTIDWSHESMTIIEALGEKFDYHELMREKLCG